MHIIVQNIGRIKCHEKNQNVGPTLLLKQQSTCNSVKGKFGDISPTDM